MIDEAREKKPKNSAVVTFLIGNGFDIGLGLKTRYSDFAATYLQHPSKTDVIAALKKTINQNIDFWGDAELAFGKLKFSDFGKDTYSVVKECVTDFSGALSEYLQDEERRFQVPADEQKVAFCTLLCSYYQRLGVYPKRNELKRLKRFNRLKVNVINFNYTETPQRYIEDSSNATITNIHGQLKYPSSVIFGYGDELDKEYNRLKEQTDNECLRYVIPIHLKYQYQDLCR